MGFCLTSTIKCRRWFGLLIYLAMSRKLLPKLETNIVKSKLNQIVLLKDLLHGLAIIVSLVVLYGGDFSGLLVLTSIVPVLRFLLAVAHQYHVLYFAHKQRIAEVIMCAFSTTITIEV